MGRRRERWTLGISHLDKVALFTSWIEEAPLLVRADREYILNQT